MKKRWSVLFWCALATLIGTSWLAQRFGLSTTAFMGVGWLGMIATTIVAFYAMVRVVPWKWPAFVALICSAPMAIDMLRVVPNLGILIELVGLPGILMLAGTAATVATEVWILRAPAPSPEPVPVPAARVVD